MSGTPRRINTDRSLGTPSAGGGAGGGVPPKAPPPPSGPAPQEDDGQSFFRPAASEMEPPAQPRRAEPDPGRGGGSGKEPPRHSAGGGRRKKRRRSPLWLPLAVVLGCMALVGCGVVYAVNYVNRVQESIRPESDAPSIVEEIQTLEEYKGDVVNILVCGIDYEEGRAYSNDGSNDGMTDMILYCQFDIKGGALRMLQIPRNTLVTTSNRTITLSSGKTYKASNYQINSVALSNGGSIAALAEVIYDQYKLPVDYYVTINMEALTEVVDNFGGIEVYIPHDMEYNGSYPGQGLPQPGRRFGRVLRPQPPRRGLRKLGHRPAEHAAVFLRRPVQAGPLHGHPGHPQPDAHHLQQLYPDGYRSGHPGQTGCVLPADRQRQHHDVQAAHLFRRRAL